ncbi:MAG: hypothetical protein LQ351_006638 [Letrouitia transgressa]|nr:MAG: hypothetical protein LQ351_006638 [Letrouitia transgressa]
MNFGPVASWLVVIAGAGGAYYYYSRSGRSRRGRGRTPYAPESLKRRTSQKRSSSNETRHATSNAKKKSKAKAGSSNVAAIDTPDLSPPSGPASGTEKIKKRKGGRYQPSQPAENSAVDIKPQQGTGDEGARVQEADIDNTEFAKQLQELKTGTSLQKPADNKTTKSKKQGKQTEPPLNSFNALAPTHNGASTTQDMSNASSTTGADADDDLSPGLSPTLDATATTTSGDVTDMLEAPAKTPSVLRLTEVEEPKRQPKHQKPAAEPETKKQRQNRRKNQERKLAREEAEKERKILLEKQRRTAREAEGRPAKNGMASSQVPVTSAWTQPISSATSESSNAPLLDTFDEGTSKPVNGHSQSTNAGQRAWHNELPSEEEQMKILSEMDGNDGWSTVQKGGKQKKKNGNVEKENGGKPSLASTNAFGDNDQSDSKYKSIAPKSIDDTPKPRNTKREDIDPKIWNRGNISKHPDFDPEFPYALTGHPEDSDWAVV